MELELYSYHKNLYPVSGFFIEEADLNNWISTIDKLGLNPSSLEIYGLPTKKANEIWGCLVVVNQSDLPEELGSYVSALTIGSKLIVPEKSKVIPELSPYDMDQLFKDGQYVMHPEIGLYQLTDPILLDEHIDLNDITIIESLRPQEYSAFTSVINGFRIESTPKEELKDELESVGEKGEFENKPLTLSEKLRLEVYKKFIITDEEEDGEISFNTQAKALQKIAEKLGLGGPDMNENLVEDYKDLQERNKREVDKLLDLLKEDPEEGLRFAIPLDEHGYSRGGRQSEFKMQDRGGDFTLFNGLKLMGALAGALAGGLGGGLGGGSGGGSVDLGDEYFRLKKQYEDSAKELIKKGEHEKAAFIYLKLLKNYLAAGATLREGKKFETAALVYLEYAENEQLAAECYEEGKIYEEAIALYDKLGQQEKVGDLYVLLGSRKSANKAYQIQVDRYMQGRHYVKAAELSKDKMLNLPYAQQILLEGWGGTTHQYSCLRNYLDNLSDTKEVWEEIKRIHEKDLDKGKDTIFLKVLKDEYFRRDENEEKIKELAYDLMSKLLEERRISAHELLPFNRENPPLRADALRFELKKNKRMTD